MINPNKFVAYSVAGFTMSEEEKKEYLKNMEAPTSLYPSILKSLMKGPILPQEVLKQKWNAMPPQVIDIFNTFIFDRFDGTEARVAECEITAEIMSQVSGTSQEQAQKWITLGLAWFRSTNAWEVYQRVTDANYDTRVYCFLASTNVGHGRI